MRPRLLDFFCGGGGAGMGYHRAGFEVVGVDILAQPRYPFRFVRGDAMSPPFDLREFDALHASPPCQNYSKALRHMADPKPELVDDVREMFMETGLPWIIENVSGAPLATYTDLFGQHGTILCGTMFGLRIYRHRLFESSFQLDPAPLCDHSRPVMNPTNEPGRQRILDEFGGTNAEIPWGREMGVEWLGRRGKRDAVPPAYTEWIGKQIIGYLGKGAK